jgi:flavin reductase (DIM6/NTAB) family NADH-FMN oxidoreductase RutF
MNAPKIDPTPAFDARDLRDVLGCFATGVTVVTTLDQTGTPVGLVVNSFSAVSLDPPLILWSIGLGSPSHQAFIDHPGFTINIMGAGSKDQTMQFARPSDDKFAGIDWRAGTHGVPVLNDAVATLECTTDQRIIAGDHEIFIGRVEQIAQTDGAPLLFHKGQFANIGDTL